MRKVRKLCRYSLGAPRSAVPPSLNISLESRAVTLSSKTLPFGSTGLPEEVGHA